MKQKSRPYGRRGDTAMSALHKYAEEPAEELLYITRTFNAPRDLVFRAWTEPRLLTRWWGPHGFTLPFCTIDLRPGGAACIRPMARTTGAGASIARS